MSAILRALQKRLGGDRPSAVQALLAAIVTGFAVAALVYRLLRA